MSFETAFFWYGWSCVAALLYLLYLLVGYRSKRTVETSDFEMADRLVNRAIGRFLGDESWTHNSVAGRLTFENHGNREHFLMDGQIVAVIQSFTADTPTGDLFKVTTFY